MNHPKNEDSLNMYSPPNSYILVQLFLFVTGHWCSMVEKSIPLSNHNRRTTRLPNQRRQVHIESEAGPSSDQHRILHDPIQQQNHSPLPHMVRQQTQLHRPQRARCSAKSIASRSLHHLGYQGQVLRHYLLQWILPRQPRRRRRCYRPRQLLPQRGG